jgi:hypothetical protein
MSVYTRRFTEDPGLAVLLNIESVNIIDVDPVAPFISSGDGVAHLVGEFEAGAFNTPTEVFGPKDLEETFGSFGYTYDAVQGNNPCARSRLADGAIVKEYWNGNGMLALNGKRFQRLIITRVDTSVGYVEFTRLASVTGVFKPTYNLEPAQVLTIQTDLAGPTDVTFSATAATVTGTAGVFTGIVAGDYIDIAIDGAATVRTTFQAADTTVTAVVSRINAAFGTTIAADSGGELALTAIQRGTGSSVQIVGGSGTVVADIGHSVGTTAGTGNVANIDAVTVAEVNTLTNAAESTANVTTDADGKILLYNNTTTGVATIKVVSSTTTALDFGFTLDTDGVQATASADVTIPAGTRVRNSGGTEWVTMEAVSAVSTAYTGWQAKVRHALDDGTGLTATTGTVNVLPFQVSGGTYAVTNPLPLTAALTELEVDAAYATALDSTKDLNNITRETTLIWCARQSNIVRQSLRANVLDASAIGCRGRVCAIRPPFGTTRTVAKGDAEPGVGAYRNERVIYCYPGVTHYVPAIALRGTAGGDGFTADGFITAGADGYMVSVCSRLPVEENPGQLTSYMDAISGLEAGTEYTGWGIEDYQSFKLEGMAAVRIDNGIPIFQSGITSVDPSSLPARVRISRRRLADKLQDDMAEIAKPYGKKISSRTLRNQFTMALNSYFEGLKADDRIDSYEVDPTSGNTPTSLAAGAFYVITKAKSYPSLDAIVIQSEVGENVVITEV